MGNLSGVPGFATKTAYYFISENTVLRYKTMLRPDGTWTLDITEAKVFDEDEYEFFKTRWPTNMGEFMPCDEAENWGIHHEFNRANFGGPAMIIVSRLEVQPMMYVGPFTTPNVALEFANKYFHKHRFLVIELEDPNFWDRAVNPEF